MLLHHMSDLCILASRACRQVALPVKRTGRHQNGTASDRLGHCTTGEQPWLLINTTHQCMVHSLHYSLSQQPGAVKSSLEASSFLS